MRNLLNFLIKYNYWFLFLLLEVTSFVLLFRFNHYQQSVYFTSANGVAGKVYEISGGISSYFHLKSVNEDLLDRNMWLEQRVAFLEKSLQEQGLDSVKLYSMARLAPDDYRIFKANVIKNSLNKADNYITLDRGSSDGIRPEMGVVDANGVVGIVYKTSPRYSLVIPLLNSKSSISCKIVGSEYFGYLKWEGGDSRFAYLKDLPRHAEFNLGDTVVTSGYSTVFPEGVMVGTVDDMSDSHDGLSYLLKIKLATDFGKVSNVRVISRSGQEEQNMLEGIIRFGGEMAKEIMTPRMDIVDLDMKTPYPEVLQCIVESNYSRIPVYADSRDNIKGVLYIKDLLPHLNKPANFRWQSLIRPPYFVPETKMIDDLLGDFQKNKVHIAIVVDEFGGTSGIVTMEDIIEEIVGEINDEYDEDERQYVRLNANTYVFEAKVLLTDFFRIMKLDDDFFEEVEGEADTLAGLLLEIKGEFPERHEVIKYKNYCFEVLEMDDRRILKIKVTVESPETSDEV